MSEPAVSLLNDKNSMDAAFPNLREKMPADLLNDIGCVVDIEC